MESRSNSKSIVDTPNIINCVFSYLDKLNSLREISKEMKICINSYREY